MMGAKWWYQLCCVLAGLVAGGQGSFSPLVHQAKFMEMQDEYRTWNHVYCLELGDLNGCLLEPRHVCSLDCIFSPGACSLSMRRFRGGVLSVFQLN